MVRAFLLIGMVAVLLAGCGEKEEDAQQAQWDKFNDMKSLKADSSKQKKQSEIKW